MNKTVASADVLIRGQGLKLNLCSESHHSHSSSAPKPIVGVGIFNQTLPKDCLRWFQTRPYPKDTHWFYRNFRQPHWEMTHFVCAGAVSSPACLPFNTRGLFLVNLHNSRTWASMGPRFHPEPTVQCYSWTLKGKVKPRKRGLRSTEFKEGNVHEVNVLWNLTGCSQVHIGVQNLSTVCAMLWAAAASTNPRTLSSQ